MQKIKLLVLLLAPVLGYCQPADFGNWFIYFGDKKLNNKWNWHHEVQYRNYNLLGNTDQLLLRTGIGYNLTENNNNLLLGYAYIYNEPNIGETDDKRNFAEHRIYQQFITRQSFGRIALQHRYRFEQRFIEDDFRLRLRYFLSANIAINQKQMQDKTLYLSAYNEIFINTEGSSYFDRNRLFGGLGYRFSKTFRAELGVMNQSTQKVSRNQLNVITFVNL
ncbi:hypothetical protein CHU92_00380 [Flavobacterium cyanobacteriorum]|uniref:DUF2490 domain-containing protein n=1 Tax=Flavobacterium cyanobacteriorum TaxID=2022802 RepID=A0A256A7Y5_9FLAO|nr:DUF2490 domain-containing protein [Flavobacterium cyanobacteriorum]OYQ49264.1 hypothetical protein CHU92_00380 [Flavobacterium cyanobacteriorum]